MGTLVDSGPQAYEALCSVFRSCGIVPPPIEIYLAEIQLNSNDFMVFYRKYGVPQSVTNVGVSSLKIEHLIDKVTTNAVDKAAALLDCSKYFGISPRLSVYVDDTFAGISAAKEAGFIAVAILGGYNDRARLESANPDHIIESMEELPALLARL